MKKILFLFFIALTCATFVSCSDDDGDSAPTVGITAVTVTPAGSAKSYSCVVNQQTLAIENTADSVDWDVADAAIASTTIKATATIGAEVYCNNELVGPDGIVADASNTVTLVAKDDAGNSKSYTLKVVKAKTAGGEDMLKKSSTLIGFPNNLVDYDMTVFNGKFYAITTSVTKGGESGDLENYQLFTSEDGMNWNEVIYKTDTKGVNLPEGQDGYVIGGEGARLAVFNGRMYVLGGARTLGADKYGNPSEADDWGWGPLKQLKYWRSFSTGDGETFRCDTVGSKQTNADGTITSTSGMLYTYLNTATLGNKLFIKGGYSYGFGMAQGARAYLYTTDGTNWTKVIPSSDDENCNVAYLIGDVFFSFKGKLWCLTGFTNYITADNAFSKTVYSSADGLKWDVAGEMADMPNLYHAKVIAGEDVAYLIGGEVLGDDGSARTLSNKIFRTTDGVNWEEVETPANFTARRNVAGVVLGNAAWLFGGISTTTSDFYGYPYGDTDILLQDTWIKLMD